MTKVVKWTECEVRKRVSIGTAESKPHKEPLLIFLLTLAYTERMSVI